MERIVNGGRITLRTLKATGKHAIFILKNDSSRINGLTCLGRKEFDSFHEAREVYNNQALGVDSVPKEWAKNQYIEISKAQLAGHTLPTVKPIEKKKEKKLPSGKLTAEEIFSLRKLMQKW